MHEYPKLAVRYAEVERYTERYPYGLGYATQHLIEINVDAEITVPRSWSDEDIEEAARRLEIKTGDGFTLKLVPGSLRISSQTDEETTLFGEWEIE